MTTPIEIGAAGEAGILIAGITVGVGMSVKIYKWINDMVDARLGRGKKYEAPPNVVPLSLTEHTEICKGVKMEFSDGFKSLSADIKALGEQRSQQVEKIYKEMKDNHTEVRNLFLTQGQRLSSVETEITNLKDKVKENGG